MSLLIQKPGILTTIQDLGRDGYRRFGINPGGVMDKAAARLANYLVGNDVGAAVLEMHFPAPQIEFEDNTIAAICGADFSAELDGEPVENWRPFFAAKSSALRFTNKVAGNRAYLAVRSGFKCDSWLGSLSTNLAVSRGGFAGRKLAANDRIELNKIVSKPIGNLSFKISSAMVPLYRPFPTVRIIPGAEFKGLDKNGRDLLQNQDFSISNNSNRMGFRLTGKPLTLSRPCELISSAVSFGTIQLLPGGQLIILMADHQTTGGYPRIGHVITRDLPLLAQLGTNDKVAFHLVELEHAEELAVEFERDLNFLRTAVKLRTFF